MCNCKNIKAAPGYEWITAKNWVKDAKNHRDCKHELKKGEVFIGNTSGTERYTKGVDIPEKYGSLKTLRLGEQAYTICGCPISRDYCRPLIIHESEYQQYQRM